MTANRMQTVTDWSSYVTSYVYDDAGRMVEKADCEPLFEQRPRLPAALAALSKLVWEEAR